MTCLIHGGHVLNRTGERLERADIRVEGDRIAAVEPDLAVHPGERVIDAAGYLVLPGLINAHTHGHNNLSRGLAGVWTLEDQLNHGAALLAGRTAEDQYISTAIGAVEMLRSGCTAAYDLCMAFPAPTREGIEGVVRAYADVGLRAVLAPAVSDIVFHRTVPDLLELLPEDLRHTVERFRAPVTGDLLELAEWTVRRWDGFAGGRLRAALAPTIPGQCTDELLTGFARLSREYGAPIQTHLAESKVQVIHALRRWGKTLVEQLSDLGLLGPHFTGAHGVWLTPDDIRLLAESGSNVAHNPASNLRLGSGIAPVAEMLEAGLDVGLGTDGSLSSDNQNMFESMRYAALVGRVRAPYHQEEWIDADCCWSMATTGSARILGMAEDIGAIEPGRKADLVLLRAGSVYLQPANHPLRALVYAETGAGVDTVLVDGAVVLEEGRVLTIDEQNLYARAREAAERLRHADPHAWTLAAQIAPFLAQACRASAQSPYPVNRYAGATD